MMFELTKENLDKRICDVEGSANEETFRDFIRNSEEEFGMEPRDLDVMTDEELHKYLEFLDYLWTK
jgi:hypothetical protein